MSEKSRTVPEDDSDVRGMWLTCGGCGAEWFQGLHRQPRSVVAISEDRQWLVVLAPPSDAESEPSFGVFRFSERWWSWEPARTKTDTGQSADDVLAAFLEERS